VTDDGVVLTAAALVAGLLPVASLVVWLLLLTLEPAAVDDDDDDDACDDIVGSDAGAALSAVDLSPVCNQQLHNVALSATYNGIFTDESRAPDHHQPRQCSQITYTTTATTVTAYFNGLTFKRF